MYFIAVNPYNLFTFNISSPHFPIVAAVLNMRVGVATIFRKDKESKLVGESTSSLRVSWLSTSFDSAKEDGIGAIKTIRRPRDPRDGVGRRLCHRRVLFNFPRMFKEDFQRNIRNKNKYKIFNNNENYLRLTFEVLSRVFFNIGKKLNLIFKE